MNMQDSQNQMTGVEFLSSNFIPARGQIVQKGLSLERG